jgi:hypothetical protein
LVHFFPPIVTAKRKKTLNLRAGGVVRLAFTLFCRPARFLSFWSWKRQVHFLGGCSVPSGAAFIVAVSAAVMSISGTTMFLMLMLIAFPFVSRAGS